MKSLRELYRIGKGPSSSHTIGPERACKQFQTKYPCADEYEVVLYGSLAKTGTGHGTDAVIKSVLKNVRIRFDTETPTAHPNTMDLIAYKNTKRQGQVRVYSVGGGAIAWGNEPQTESKEQYPHNTFTEIRAYCEKHGLRLYEYVTECEGDEIRTFLFEVWQTMKNAIARGVEKSGVLPGGLNVERRAKVLYTSRETDESAETRENRLVCAYAFAAMRAINASLLAHFLSDSRKISFDLVVRTMYETGKDIRNPYRETSEGGLAKLYRK